MRNSYTRLALLVALTFIVKITLSQNLVSSWYTFTSTSTTYTAVTGGTTMGTNANDDDTFNSVPIGFTFNFLGVNCTSVAVNANGYLKFGVTLNNFSTSPIDDYYGDDSLICALGVDIASNATGVMRHTLSGTSPNRIFTMQWSNYTTYGNTDNLNFQIKLYETTNKIDVIYGSFTLSQPGSAEVGLRGVSNTDYNNRSVLNGTTTWSASTAGVNNYDYCEFTNGPPVFKPASGQKYTWSPPPACTTTPIAGTLTTSSGTIDCTGQSLNLNVGGSTIATGLSYQWQSSTNGTTWTAVSSATNSNYSPTYSTSIYYRRVTGCSTSTAASNSLNFTTIPTVSYATVPFLENFDNTWQNRCDLRNVPNSSYWTSYPTTADSSWRREDDGISANWASSGGTVSPLAGAGCADFDSYDSYYATSGYLDLHVNMGTTQDYNVKFYHTNSYGGDSLEVYLSKNGGTSFVRQAVYYSGDINPVEANWNQKSLVLPAVNSSSCILRFKGYADGTSDIGVDSLKIAVIPPCTGTPVAGTLTSSTGTVNCVGTPLTLTVTGSTFASGLTYQWQSSANGTTWTPIASATNQPYPLTYTSTLYYRRVIACSTNTSATNAVDLINIPAVTYAPVPFLENFDNTWQNRCDNRNVPLTSFWSSNPTQSDSSWRRQDDGISANWTNPNSAIVTPLAGSGAADFHSYYASAGTSGALDLHVNMGTTQNYTVSFYHLNVDGTDSLEVFLSTNGGSTFTKKAGLQSGDVTSLTSWSKKSITLTSVNSASCVLRFKGTSDYGNSDIGIDSLKISTLCLTPTITIAASSTSLCSGGTVTLTASGASSYTWNTTATTTAIAPGPTVTTIYTVTGSNGTGCTSTKTIQVFVNASPTIAAVNASICAGSSTVITASGASTYTWNSGATTASISLSPTTTTVYTVTGNSSGCNGTKTISVLVNPSLTLTVNNASICTGNSTVITASGATNYTWSTGATTASVSLSPTVTTNYTVTGNSGSCPGTKTVSVLVNANPTLAVNNGTICSGSSTVLTASGATTYTWSTGANTTSVSVNPSSTTVYTVSGSNALGCISSRTVQLLVNATPTLVVNSTTICPGQTATLSVSGATSYTWSTGSTASFVTVSPTVNTTYTIFGLSTGCSNTKTVSVTIGASLGIGVTGNPTSLCSGGTSTLTASGATSYTWSTGATTSTIAVTPTSTTIYTITGTNGACSGTGSISMVVNANPTVNAVAIISPTICIGSVTTLSASGAVNYTWSPGGATGSTFSVSPTSSTIYTVFGLSIGGCSGTKTIAITVNSAPIVSLSISSPSVCSGNTVSLIASGATNYTWSTGSNSSSISVSPSVTTSYTVNGSNAAGCINTVTTQIVVNATPVISVNSSTICTADSTILTASGATSYSWNTGSAVASVTVSPALSTIYTVTGSSAGCSAFATASVYVIAPVTITVAGSPTSICIGDISTLTASGAATYTWNTGATGSTYTVSPATSTQYTITGSNGLCSGTQTFNLVVNSTPTVTATSAASAICLGDVTNLTASGASSYTWSPGNFSGSAFSVSPAINTDYTVTGTDVNGCISTQSLTVVVNNPPTLSVSVNPTVICSGETVTLTAAGAINYTWSTGSNSSSTIDNPTITTTYTVIGDDTNGCSASASTQLSVNPGPSLTVNSASTCSNGNATLTASGASTYSWSNGSTSSSIVVAPTSNTTYTVTGSALGCSDTETASVTIFNSVNITISGNLAICAGDSSTLTASGATTYSWSTGASSASVMVMPTALTVYTVDGFIGTCSGSQTISIVVNATPTLVTTVSSSSICTGSSATLTASGAGTYLWMPGSFAGGVYSVSPTSSTHYTVVGTDPNGCSATATTNVIVDQLPTQALAGTSQTICGSTATLNANAPLIGAGLWTLVSGTASINTPTLATTHVSLSNGSSVFEWVISNGVCPSSTSTVLIHASATPTLGISSSASIICIAGSASLTASGASAYSWNSGQTTPVIVVSPTVTTTYTVTGSNGICSSSAVITQSVSDCTGITVISQPSGYNASVYPNPFGELVTVTAGETVSVTFFSTLGASILNQTIYGTGTINTHEISKGIYYVVVKGALWTRTFKIIRD